MTLTAVLLIGNLMMGQGWVPFQPGPAPDKSIQVLERAKALSEANLLTIAYSTQNGVNVKQYNGLSWASLPQNASNTQSDFAVDLIRFQGDLYLLTKKLLQKFDGQAWFNVASLPAGTYTDIEIYNGELVFGWDNWGSGTTNLRTYDGTVIGQLPSPSTPLDSVAALQVFNNELYVATGTYFPSLSGGITVLARFDGTAWAEAAQYLDVGATQGVNGEHVFVLKGKLYLSGFTNIFEVRNDSLVVVASRNKGFFGRYF